LNWRRYCSWGDIWLFPLLFVRHKKTQSSAKGLLEHDNHMRIPFANPVNFCVSEGESQANNSTRLGIFFICGSLMQVLPPILSKDE
jgi:hypothetical protein